MTLKLIRYDVHFDKRYIFYGPIPLTDLKIHLKKDNLINYELRWQWAFTYLFYEWR